jgi:hypothetical protein
VQYAVNEAAATWRASKLNELLPNLQDEFEAALNRGVILELEPGDTVTELVEAANAEAAL